MTRLKLFSAAAVLAALALAPSLAEARSHHRHHARPYWLPYEISYLHNYGPGLLPGTFAYYDGPSTGACAQSDAGAYIAASDRPQAPANGSQD